MWGYATRIGTAYLRRLNAGYAAKMVTGGMKIGTGIGGIRGVGYGAGIAGKGLYNWAWKNQVSPLTRSIRTGTAVGAGLLAGNVLNPRNNRGPF